MFSVDAVLYYASHPVEFVEDIIKVKPDDIQAEILRSLVNNQMTSVRSGHGVGKSAVQAWAIIWFMLTRPFPKIPCTAPTQHQLFDILWAEVSKWIRGNPVLSDGLIWTHEKLYMKEHPEEWFAVPRTATHPDALQGFHAEHVLYILDEASGIRDEIFEPVLGALSTPGAKLLMCGNPTKTEGFFYESHHKNRTSYKTFHIDGRTSSRVSPQYVKMIVDMYGEDSDMFRVRVAGEFPLQGDDVFIPLHLVDRSIKTPCRAYENGEKPMLIHVACDVARFGGDKTVIAYRIDEKIDFHKKVSGQDTMRTAGEIVILCEKLIEKYDYNHPIAVKIDDGGVGGGVVDRLNQIKRNNKKRFWWLEILPVAFGKPIRHTHYYDSTSYMMGVLKNLLKTSDEDGSDKPVDIILPDDPALIAQLTTRKYGITDNSKIKVESKKDMKKRGLPSPDEADCVLLCCLPVNLKKNRRNGD